MSAAVKTATTPGAARTASRSSDGQPRMAVGGEAEGEVERAGRLGQIVDIGRGAGDMEVGAVVRQRLVDGALSHGAR